MISRSSVGRFSATLASNCWNLAVSSFSSFCEAGCGFVAMFNYSLKALSRREQSEAEREPAAEILSVAPSVGREVEGAALLRSRFVAQEIIRTTLGAGAVPGLHSSNKMIPRLQSAYPIHNGPPLIRRTSPQRTTETAKNGRAKCPALQRLNGVEAVFVAWGRIGPFVSLRCTVKLDTAV